MQDDECPVYELFHETSKLNEISEHDMSVRIGALYEDPARLAACRTAFKVYPYARRIDLPAVAVSETTLTEVLARRRSVRQFEEGPVTLGELSSLLRFSYGITGGLESNGEVVQKVRAAPSAGGLYPIEIYPVLLSCQGAPAGVYHYNVAQNAIELLREGSFRAEISSAMPAQFSLNTAAAVIVLSAAFGKTTHKYGERGYRFVLLDAGHVMQNLYLTVTAARLGCYSVGGFRDDEMDSLLGLDGASETALYACVMGRPTKASDADAAGASEH